MDLGTLLSMTQTFLELLDSSVMKEIESVWNFRSQLEEMKGSMSTIKAVLLDAERQERQLFQLREADRDWLDKLTDAIYEADDLFDEIATLAQREMLMSGGKLSKKVRLFFSRSNNPLLFAHNTSREIKKIRKSLDGIANDRRDFGSIGLGQQVSDSWTIVKREIANTHSFVHVGDVIGRVNDKKAVVDMLLDLDESSGSIQEEKEDVSFVTIVGIGGLGKTTLAQLVYNDEKIQREFLTKLWVCVCDEDNFDVKSIVAKILQSATGSSCDEKKIEMDHLQCQLRQQIVGKKYFLVLDDMWNEDRHKWLELWGFLKLGGKGSRVLVTSRSKRVADIIGSGHTYELKGLSEEDSRRLFENMAFGEGPRDPDLVEIGQEIVKKCANVPLAIRVIGSLLYGQSKSRWQLFRNVDLASLRQEGSSSILPILKLSYYNLPCHLKTCFNYCAIFPKDYEIEKQTLISLWMAQGFILPSRGQSIEDAGEEYFTTLLQRCFFQDVRLYVHSDEIDSFKIHDLMHDVAQEEAGERILVAGSNTSHISDKICHIALEAELTQSIVSCLSKRKRVRTFLRLECMSFFQSDIDYRLLLGAKCLRVLDLSNSSFKRLPSEIGELLHLRYLDLSRNHQLEMLSVSITKLHNLQLLILCNCYALKELPTDLSKLVNLKHLDVTDNHKLTRMPPGMNNLSGLHTLPTFVVGEARATFNGKKVAVGQLQDLQALINLRGTLRINILENSTIDVAKVKAAGFTRNMEHLHSIDLDIHWKTNDDERDEALLEGLRPHPNLKCFYLIGYRGVRFPSWASMNNLGTWLPNLVRIMLSRCTRLQYLPLLSQLRYLEELELNELTELEYVDSSISISIRGEAGLGAEAGPQELLFFPSLKQLVLYNLPKLEGWWRSSSLEGKANDDDGSGRRKQEQEESSSLLLPPSFPRLRSLAIKSCPKLTSIPLCPSVQCLQLQKFNVRDTDTDASSSYSPSPSSNATTISQQPPLKLEEMIIDDVGYLNCLPLESFQALSSMYISGDQKLESLATDNNVIGKVLLTCRSSLKKLVIRRCPKLKRLNLSLILEHLTALESLKLGSLPELVLDSNEHDDDDMSWRWRCHQHSLRSLELQYLPKMRNLPKGMMQCLTSLQSLKISNCQNLEALPEWIGCLSSLQSLKIDNSGVTARCDAEAHLPQQAWHLGMYTGNEAEVPKPDWARLAQNSTHPLY